MSCSFLTIFKLKSKEQYDEKIVVVLHGTKDNIEESICLINEDYPDMKKK